MTRRIVVERAAEEDVLQAVRYYVRQRTPTIAQRFVTAAVETFAQWAETPVQTAPDDHDTHARRQED